jgi:hypothetical protein
LNPGFTKAAAQGLLEEEQPVKLVGEELDIESKDVATIAVALDEETGHAGDAQVWYRTCCHAAAHVIAWYSQCRGSRGSSTCGDNAQSVHVMQKVSLAQLTKTNVSAARSLEYLNSEYVLQAGDAVLIEAYQSLARKHSLSEHFALLREVGDSQPPRTTGLMDRCVSSLTRLCSLSSLLPPPSSSLLAHSPALLCSALLCSALLCSALY